MIQTLYKLLASAKAADFLAPLAFRLYLAPIFIVFGYHKAVNIENIAQWFDVGLGLPMPLVMAYLAAYTELLGGVALLVGLATRFVCVPLMITMLVAALTAHWDNGWFAIAPSDPDTNIAKLLVPLGVDAAQQSLENSAAVSERLTAARNLLKTHGNYGWLSETGSFVVLNNGIEFAATYFIMLLSLFFTGAGRWVSIDDWILRAQPPEKERIYSA